MLLSSTCDYILIREHSGDGMEFVRIEAHGWGCLKGDEWGEIEVMKGVLGCWEEK